MVRIARYLSLINPNELLYVTDMFPCTSDMKSGVDQVTQAFEFLLHKSWVDRNSIIGVNFHDIGKAVG